MTEDSIPSNPLPSWQSQAERSSQQRMPQEQCGGSVKKGNGTTGLEAIGTPSTFNAFKGATVGQCGQNCYGTKGRDKYSSANTLCECIHIHHRIYQESKWTEPIICKHGRVCDVSLLHHFITVLCQITNVPSSGYGLNDFS